MITPDLDKVDDLDDFFGIIRAGDAQKLEIGLSAERMFPVRLLPAKEEAAIIAKAKVKANQENLLPGESEVMVSYETMIWTLVAATSIRGAVGIPLKKLEGLPTTHLVALFDQYMSLNKTINPDFQTLSLAQINELVETVRQKKTRVKDYYTWQLAAVGRLYLEELQRTSPMVNEPGSQ